MARKGLSKRIVQKKKRRVRNPSTQNAAGRNLAVGGLRRLLTCIPGVSSLLPIADVLFSALSYVVTKNRDPITKTIQADTKTYGLVTRICVKGLNLLGNSPLLARDYTGQHPTVYTNLRECRTKVISFSMKLDNVQSSRSGKWGAVILPFREASDYSYYIKEAALDGVTRDLRRLASIPGAKICNSDQQIKLTYRVKTTDGFINLYHSLEEPVAVIFIAYEEELRDKFANFKAADFSPNITVSGKLDIRSPTKSISVKGYEDSFPNYSDVPAVTLFDPPNGYRECYHHEIISQNEHEDGVLLMLKDKEEVTTPNNDGFCHIEMTE